MVIPIKYSSQLLFMKPYAKLFGFVFSLNPSGALCGRCYYDSAKARLKILSKLVPQPVNDEC